MECSNLIETELKKRDLEERSNNGFTAGLFELGFQKELKWNTYQADGDYVDSTASTVMDFAKRNQNKYNRDTNIAQRT